MPHNSAASADAPLRLHTIAGLLDRLAKRDAFGEITLAGDGTRALAIAAPGLTGRPLCVATWVVFQDACELGLLSSPGDEGVRWILSRLGRVELRRMRSQAGEPSNTPASSSKSHASMAAACHIDGTAPRFNATESPLSWLRRRRDKTGEPLITVVQFDAGERLTGDFLFAEMTPRVTVNWSATGGSTGRSGGGLGIDLRDNVVAAKGRVNRALAAVGPMGASLLIDVCGHLRGLEEVERARGWPPRSGKIALQMALSELARHYRIPGAEEGSERVAQRLRHWGVGDYRPAITPPDPRHE